MLTTKLHALKLSYAPLINCKVSWIHSLVTRVKRVSSVNLLPEHINEIKKFAFSNGFPKSILTLIVKSASSKSINDNHTDGDNDTIKSYPSLLYFRKAGEMRLKSALER